MISRSFIVTIVGLFLIVTYWSLFFVSLKDVRWLDKLPECPCLSPDIDLKKDGWAHEKTDLSRFHKGASIAFRSYPPVKTNVGNSGQQCCYDENGYLLTTNEAAGTPDRSGVCVGEDESGAMIVDYLGVIKHFVNDVIPFFVLDIETYHKFWVPNKGRDCKN